MKPPPCKTSHRISVACSSFTMPKGGGMVWDEATGTRCVVRERGITGEEIKCCLAQICASHGPRATYGPLVHSDWTVKG